MTATLPRWRYAAAPWGWGGSAFTGRRIVVFGLLWAAAQVAMGSFGLPLENLSWAELLRLYFEIALSWALMGVSGAYVAKRIAARFSLPMVVLTIVAMSFGVTGIRYAAEAMLGLSTVPLFESRSVWPAYLFDSWGFMLYGGLFMLGCVFTLRAEHTRDLLGQAEIARGQTEALLSEAELETLRGHVDPALLLRVMAEVQRRYGSDSVGADRLLEQLVNFLRRAMPGVRTGASTLAAEVKLARAHVRLLAEIDPQHTTWRMRVEPGLPELPFPPLLLLPVLDALAAASPPGSTCGLTIERADQTDALTARGAIALRLDSPAVAPRWLPDALERRLRVGLGSAFGHAWSLLIGEAATAKTAPMVLTLNFPAPHGMASPTLVPPTDLETHDE